MSHDVEPEEVQAILDAVGGAAPRRRPADVVARNFREPRRLSSERIKYLAKLVEAVLPDVCNDVAAPLRQYRRISLASVSEVNTIDLFRDVEAPLAVYCFESRGHVSWLVWDAAAAAATVDTILSGPPDGGPAPPARRLSRSECRVLETLLGHLVGPIAEALGLELAGGRLAQEPEELATLEGSGPDADPRRLLLHFLFEGPGEPSELRVYVPDTSEAGPRSPSAERRPPLALPDHLETVRLPLSAYLGSVDIPLTDLLAIEVGDVVPLGVEEGSCVDVYVGDRPCGKAAWGRSRGNLAIKIRELDTRLGGIDQPTVPESDR